MPLVTGVFNAASSSVLTFASQASEQAVSRDLATIVGFDNELFFLQFSTGEFNLINTASGLTRTVATGRDRLSPSAFSRLGDRFSVIGIDRVRVYDVATADQGALLDAPSGPGPEFDGAYELILSEDGALTVLDMALGQVLNSLQMTGSIVEIHADPASTRAWLRTDGAAGNALVLVETSAPGGIATSNTSTAIAVTFR